jgi:hypothetical protein
LGGNGSWCHAVSSEWVVVRVRDWLFHLERGHDDDEQEEQEEQEDEEDALVVVVGAPEVEGEGSLEDAGGW